MVEPSTLVIRISVESGFDELELLLESGLQTLLGGVVFGQQIAPLVPGRVVGKVLLDFCGCELELERNAPFASRKRGYPTPIVPAVNYKKGI
jgi:hypothetical protein